MQPTQGLLIINLGSPEACTLPAVRSYLQEFLMDEDVIALPWVFRWLLVYGLITPTRAKRSLHAYQMIWEQGSPLIKHTHLLAEGLQRALPKDQWVVEYAMRYKYPSIESALKRFKEQGIQHLTVLPLYPQAAAAVTTSAVKEVQRCLKKVQATWTTSYLPAFFNQRFFIDALASVAHKVMLHEPFDHLLMSYHGLPEQAVVKAGCRHRAQCARCPSDDASLESCYRAQCFETSQLLATTLGLSEEHWSIGFQSRLGRLPWIGPNTETALDSLWEQGVRRLALICPSFVADCLETLEEINIRAREQWEAKGGTFIYIPCLNEDETWVDGLSLKIAQCSRLGSVVKSTAT